MAFTRLQTNGANGAVTTCAFSSSCTTGTLLVAHWYGHETAGVTVSDPTNGAWTVTADEGPNIADSSSKHAIWAYVLSNTATTAITVTFANTNSTDFIQVAEYKYKGRIAYDTSVYVMNAQAAGVFGATRTLTGGTPTANGLFLMGCGDNTEGGSTITVSSGLDGMVGTCGSAGGVQTMGLAEKLLTAGANTGVLSTLPNATGNERYATCVGFYEIAPNVTVITQQAIDRASRW